jgi:putative membrane protein
MLTDAIVAWLHFLGIFVMIGALAGELMLFRREITAPAQRTIRVLDLHYGAAAGLVLVTGFARAIWTDKGWDYYAGNPFFWILVTLFAAVGLLSLPPTFYFLGWRRSAGAVTVAERDYRRIRRLLWLEAAGLTLAPLAATLMAHGVGW